MIYGAPSNTTPTRRWASALGVAHGVQIAPASYRGLAIHLQPLENGRPSTGTLKVWQWVKVGRWSIRERWTWLGGAYLG